MPVSLIDFDDPALIALRDSYKASLPQKLAELEEIWTALTEKGWQTEDRTRLQAKNHILTSSAGSYGFSALSAAARSVELLIKQVAGDITPLRTSLIDELTTGMSMTATSIMAAMGAEALQVPAPESRQ